MTALESIGKYKIRREIGHGAMGVVFEAFDSVIERRVAIKMLRVDVFDAGQLADVRVRFKREAHSAGRLSHPNIVTIFDYGEHEGTPFIVMDLMSGEELSRRLDGDARVSLPEAVRIMGQLLGALSYAHESGVVHRDIKPANIFILRDGSLKVVDFGVARVEASELTQTGAMIGTPAYMSPEQFLGLPVDARSDIFSAGVIFYQLLTGDRPFTGSATTIMQKVLRQEPVEPSLLNPTLSPVWDTVVKRALAKKPDERFQSARQFSDAINLAAGAGKAPQADAAAATVVDDATLPIDRSAHPPAAALPPPRKAPRIALVLVAAAGLVAAGALLYRVLAPVERPAPVAAQPAAVAKAPAAEAPPEKAKAAQDEAAAAQALAAQKRAEAERKAKLEAERRAALEAERKAKAEAERRAALEAERRAKAAAERRAALAAEEKARVEAERRAALEAQQKAKLEAQQQKAKLEAERKAKAAAERPPSRRERAEAERARRAEAARLRAEQAAARPAQQAAVAPAPLAPAPAPAAAAPYRGKVVSLEKNWGFVIVESASPGGGVRLGERLYATLAGGRRVEIVVRRISGNLVSAVPDGGISDDLLGASVTQR